MNYSETCLKQSSNLGVRGSNPFRRANSRAMFDNALRRAQAGVAFGQLGETLVGRLLFLKVLLENRRAVLALEALRPGDDEP
jgi:hypothetical protein